MADYRKPGQCNDIRLTFCWPRVRRGFYELAAPRPSLTATEALQLIAELYRVETEIRDEAPTNAASSANSEADFWSTCSTRGVGRRSR